VVNFALYSRLIVVYKTKAALYFSADMTALKTMANINFMVIEQLYIYRKRRGCGGDSRERAGNFEAHHEPAMKENGSKKKSPNCSAPHALATSFMKRSFKLESSACLKDEKQLLITYFDSDKQSRSAGE
jgi:hypothetical protein